MKDYLTYITQYSMWLKNKCTSDFKRLPVCSWNMMHESTRILENSLYGGTQQYQVSRSISHYVIAMGEKSPLMLCRSVEE